MSEHHWITLHRVRFPDEISALERAFQPVSGATCWRFCVSHTLGDNKMPTWTSRDWCGLGIWKYRQDAEDFLSDPVAAMPAFAEAVETWHALCVPIQHRGEVNWRGYVESDSAIRVCSEDPEGPLAVMTSAGFNDPRNPDEIPRISRFVVNVAAVIGFLAKQPGNLKSAVFNGGFDAKEGFTLTLWENDEAMLKAAYHSGQHRELMDQSRDGSVFDRSSFTRLRILKSRGSWDGDPLVRVA